MGLNIRSEEVNRLAAKLAKKRNLTKTEAVRLALVNELGRDEPKITLREKVEPIIAFLAAYPRTGLAADKAFFDDVNGDC